MKYLVIGRLAAQHCIIGALGSSHFLSLFDHLLDPMTYRIHGWDQVMSNIYILFEAVCGRIAALLMSEFSMPCCGQGLDGTEFTFEAWINTADYCHRGMCLKSTSRADQRCMKPLVDLNELPYGRCADCRSYSVTMCAMT